MNMWQYLFYPNPGAAEYTSPKALVLLIACALLVLASVGIRLWRRRLKNPVTKRLSKSWASAALWFGIFGLVLVVSRVETVSYLSMRFWWILWAIALAMYLFVQVRLYRARHYVPLPKQTVNDPRKKYLPKKKKR